MRFIWDIQALRFHGYHVSLRCNHVLIMGFKNIPGDRRMRCYTCEFEAAERWPTLPEAEAIARQDAQYKIPWRERGAYHK